MQKVEQLVFGWLEEKLKEEAFRDVFIIDIRLGARQRLVVTIDSDEHLQIERCAILSRYLEQHLDETQVLGENYTIEVSSPGIETPLNHPRQLPKNVGREVNITLKNGSILEGKLTATDQETLTIETIEKIALEGKKKKEEQVRQQLIRLEDLKHIVVKINFGKA